MAVQAALVYSLQMTGGVITLHNNNVCDLHEVSATASLSGEISEDTNDTPQCEMMDSEVSVLLHCAAWSGLLESQVQVELSESFNRKTDPALERQIEEVWTERVSKEPWLFNGSKFRLHSFCLASSSSVSPKHPSCTRSLVDRAEDQKVECTSDFAAQNSCHIPVDQAENTDHQEAAPLPHSETRPDMLQGLPGNKLVVSSDGAPSAWRGRVQ
ncbi:Uridine diphosphate glucose pyrophosphatase [Larimichthys crocea]|uniref:Uncharacterized protein n=1 Tax=Larimichthys crocea TaxID=215358 RepID=A0ACD3RE31_LARCR|nr:Uridine diphosphate glucose pyrophosphatase [Larimichthys crocea]